MVISWEVIRGSCHAASWLSDKLSCTQAVKRKKLTPSEILQIRCQQNVSELTSASIKLTTSMGELNETLSLKTFIMSWSRFQYL